jgi:glutamine amidotransferase
MAITIIDYGIGNLGSILNMLRKIGADAVISSSKEEIEKANKLILPGIGAFDSGMKKLLEKNILDVLNKKVLEEKVPVLGICLGMQLMTEKSGEGSIGGLGWIRGEAVRFEFGTNEKKYKVPHMGWNYVHPCKESRLLTGMYADPRFYFVHSYYIKCAKPTDVLLKCNYAFDFDAAFERDNIFGVQFHPEKSHKYGMKLLKNFADL